jgi:hypothetical protein
MIARTTDQEAALSTGIKGWFAGCVAATIVLFLHGLVLTALEPNGLSFKLLLVGLFLSIVYFTFIAIFTAIPVGIFMWVAHKFGLESLVLFAGCGGALGWLGNYLFNPFIRDTILWHFVLAGVVAGIVAWYFKRRLPRPNNYEAATPTTFGRTGGDQR